MSPSGLSQKKMILFVETLQVVFFRVCLKSYPVHSVITRARRQLLFFIFWASCIKGVNTCKSFDISINSFWIILKFQREERLDINLQLWL